MANARVKMNNNSDAEEKLAQEVIDQYLAAKADKESKGLHDDWATYDDYYNSRQNEPEDEDDPGSVTNIVHPLIENQVAETTDANIEITAEPYDVAGVNLVESVERALMWVKDYNRFTVKLERGERWRRKFGTVWSHVTFDPNENYPVGMVKLGWENPAQVFPDPKVKAPHLIDDAEFIILEIVKPLSWFTRNFPQKGTYVKADTVGFGGGEVFTDEVTNASMNVGANQARLLIRYSFDDEGFLRCVKLGGQDARVVLYDSAADESLVDAETKERKPWLRLRKYPIRPLVLYPREGQIWGMGDIELVKPIQDLINELDDQIRMNAKQMAWLTWFISASARVNIKLLNTRKPGTVVPIGGNLPPGQAVHMAQPKEMPAYISQRRENAKGEAERATARPGVNDGFRPGGVDTYGGLALLQQQGQKKGNHQLKMLYEHLAEMFETALEMMKQLMTETLPVPYQDANGERKWMGFKGSNLAALTRMVYDPEKGTWKPDESLDKAEGRWRIHVKASAGMPKDNVAQYGNLLALMQSSASQTLFSGLGPDEIRRIQKQIFGMIGVQLSDTPPVLPQGAPGQPPAAQGAPPQMQGGAPQMQGAAPQAQPAAQAPVGQAPVQEAPGRGIPTALQSALQGADPAEAQAMWDSLPQQIKDAMSAQFGGAA